MACTLEDQARELRHIAGCIRDSGDVTHSLRALRIVGELSRELDVERLVARSFESLGAVVPPHIRVLSKTDTET